MHRQSGPDAPWEGFVRIRIVITIEIEIKLLGKLSKKKKKKIANKSPAAAAD
jgi:hypothetical protein